MTGTSHPTTLRPSASWSSAYTDFLPSRHPVLPGVASPVTSTG
ncbi:hypothetical protein [Serinicoccus marinus]|nr:hypothetical protein [Serinicoccus marinus]